MEGRGAGLAAILTVATAAATAVGASAAEKLLPPPTRYFNDYAGLVSARNAERLEAKLRAFDEQSSNQVLVAVFPELPSPSLEDFTIRTAQSWRAGREKLDNGVVLFVFVKDRKVRIEVGYGLEGALPDATAKRIIDEQIVPGFRAGNYTGGVEAAVDAIIAATRGEYPAAARPATVNGRSEWHPGLVLFLVFVVLGFFWVMWLGFRQSSGADYWSGGSSSGADYSSGGSSSGGGSDGGGGFSGGGGSFGGGGASGSW